MHTPTKPSKVDAAVEVWMEVRDRRQIAKLMVIQDVSMRQLAKGAGFKSWSYLGKILRGEVKTLSAERAVGIATYLGVGVDDLFLGRLSTDTARNVKSHRAGRAA